MISFLTMVQIITCLGSIVIASIYFRRLKEMDRADLELMKLLEAIDKLSVEFKKGIEGKKPED